MRTTILAVILTIFLLGAIRLEPSAEAAKKVTCATCPVAAVDAHATTPLGSVNKTSGCHVQNGSAGLPMQDPDCTPGALNPTVTEAILKSDNFRTGCVRNCITSESAKHIVYTNYGIREDRATCELDHLVPLELGGADSLNNIWPQCGPAHAKGMKIFFKEKDQVEDYLTTRVKSGDMSLRDAQERIAKDWTTIREEAATFCASHKCGSEQ